MERNEIDKLITNNMGLVYHVVQTHFPTFSHDEDIIQIGMVGLCRAGNTWDATKSKFSSYACMLIYQEICKHFRDNKKHKGVLSLSNETRAGTQYADIIVGTDDVDYADIDGMNRFLESLTPRQREILDYTRKYGAYEAARRLVITKQRVYNVTNTIKKKWRDFNE